MRGIIIGLYAVTSSSCAGSAYESDASSECSPTCAETVALTFDLEHECIPANQIPTDLGCIPLDPCIESPGLDRHCYISPEHNLIVINPNQVTHPDVITYLKEQFGWVNCEDVVDEVPQEFMNMFPVCGESVN
ncbi:MAG: hypothetical protein ABIK09_19860 [Pseudomonadota bacterium]